MPRPHIELSRVNRRLAALRARVRRPSRKGLLRIGLALVVVYLLGLQVDLDSDVRSLECQSFSASQTAFANDPYLTHYYYQNFAVRSVLLDMQFMQVLRDYREYTHISYTRTTTETRSKDAESPDVHVAGILRPPWRPPADVKCSAS